jgi:predicted ATPase/DNA-binding SARP family transcriptional activator/DNA-binding CsgD family transcriptional regulator
LGDRIADIEEDTERMGRRPQREPAAQQLQHRGVHTDSETARRSELEVVRIGLLGGFRLSVGPRLIEEDQWRLRRARSLLKLLTLAPGHHLHREQVMETLWPDLGMRRASNNLHYALHTVRRALEPSAMASRSAASSGYLFLRDEQLILCPDSPLWVDVEAFEQAASAARHAMEPQAFRAAIDLYSGELLPQDRYETWAEERRAQLRGLYISLLLEVSGIYEDRKEYEEAIEALGRVLAEDTMYEEAHVGLMRVYAVLGRRREALGQYERLRDALHRELGSEPEAATVRLHEEIWAGALPPARSPLAAGSQSEDLPAAGFGGRHNLPLARTSFIGRGAESLEVKRLLAMTRLLTLTGVGGSGKTRLAIEVAKDLVEAYPDGAWLVELASLSQGELVPQAVARALKAREQPGRPLLETLKDALRTKTMLLVMDNCEHLIQAVVRLLDALLDSCPGLRILATSRETLNAAGEVNWVVPSLTVPYSRQEAYTPQELEAYESVRLFVERAYQRKPSFQLTLRNGQAVSQVCRHLEGIPLAIELASGRIGVLSAEQLASRLVDSLKLLTGGRTADPRHRTLRATLAWSHDLLSEPERTLFRRLSVFAGGGTLEAAEEVCSGEGIEQDDVLDILSKLVDKSLVVAEASPGVEGELRYRMLEPIRQYGQERLQQSGEADAIRERHAASFLALAEQAGPELRGPRQVMWLKRLDTERDNVRGAMRWLLGQGESQTVARIGWALWLFWWMHGHFTEGRRWMEEALAKGSAMTAAFRAKTLFVAGTMADGQADRRSAEPLLEESLMLFRQLGDKLGSAFALSGVGLVAVGQGHHERGVAFFNEAVDLFLKKGERWGASVTLSFLAVGWFGRGDPIRAKRLAERGLELARESGATEGICVACHTGAMVAHAEGDHERARGLLQEGLKLAAEAGNETNVAYYLEGLAASAALESRLERAAGLWGAAEALLEKIEVAAYIYAPDRSVYQGQVSAARARLEEAAWQRAWTEGRAMTSERAIEYALSEEKEEHEEPPKLVAAPEQQPPAPDERTQSLTDREQEVALLLGRGLTNRRIAKKLSISEHTVATHVGKILKKLGLRSRAQISSS